MNKINVGLYAITNELQGSALVNAVKSILEGGATLVQYRNKNQHPENGYQEARLLKILCDQYNVPLIINDDILLAKKINAGVHLGQRDGSVLHAREELGKHAIIGVTCHSSVEWAKKAEQEGADYAAFGCCFPSLTKPEAKPLQWDALREARENLSIPLVGIGGITLDNAKQVLNAGAQILAVIHDLYNHGDIQAQARAYTTLIQGFHYE